MLKKDIRAAAIAVHQQPKRQKDETMKIHHATAAAAEKNEIGMEVCEVEDRNFIKATDKTVRPQRSIMGRNGKEVLASALLLRSIKAEYPALDIVFDTASMEYQGTCLEIIEDADDETRLVWKGATCPTLADLLDAVADYNEDKGADLDPEAGYSEDKVGVVVPAKYKEAYRVAGNPNNCGDEFAEFCDGKFIGQDAKFNIEDYLDFCALNDVLPTEKLAAMMEAANRGWTGRMRMNMGQMMRRKVAAVGEVKYITATGEEKVYKFSTAYLQTLLEKFPKVEPLWADEA